MKKLAVVLGATLLVLVSWAPAQSASAGTPPVKKPSLHIDYKTSTIFQFDGSPNGNGPTIPATTVKAVVKNCPAGDYVLDGTFVQRGITMPVARDALGGGEYTCTGSKWTPVSIAFGDPNLRPGYAKVNLSFHPFGCESASCSFESKRVVRVPGKITSIEIDKKTSKIYLYDEGSTGGPGEPTVNTSFEVKNCPDGDYRFGGSLVQDGVEVPAVRDALGAGEMTCRGGTSTFPLGAAFTSRKLHPGWAKASYSFAPYNCESSACAYTATRIVRIPGKRLCPPSTSGSRKVA